MRSVGALAMGVAGARCAGADPHSDKGPPVVAWPAPADVACILTPEQVEGPFFVDTGLERSDITEGRPGVMLHLRLTLVDVDTCSLIEGAVFELWHADADGSYSGFNRAHGNVSDSAGSTFLRGYQRTDRSGGVEFTTIYPGWYPGRAPHVHLAILAQGDRLVTTQLYFDEAQSDLVYQQEPYAARGAADTSNADDVISRVGGAAGPAPLLLDASEIDGGYEARFVVGFAGAS
ncbi:MAG: intradiol ring-cleavage dioxygenase [Myxococcales bacterium]|nr:intradiol ring-cleavage dioxygenase [Myxococcales bacterium]